jgi:hypothetical protein
MIPPITLGGHTPRMAHFIVYGHDGVTVQDIYEASEGEPHEWERIVQLSAMYHLSGARGTVILVKSDLSHEEREYDSANPFQD